MLFSLREGLSSKYVHTFIATLHFSDKSKVDEYKVLDVK